ncbi:hypothetical protein [Methylobacterium sp. Leaf100]|uniref:hypothetical protein n=1 Tax=Methylobacterium sp. Leaf100 TaxID=1736252 RepID=UPI0006FF581B|nr:hypothetical protein [Methylobacterium sp. Leaf100]KQP36705.1 hypothetical protein ASF25_01750 [Methylobacterium sp. Leaf100]
MAEPRRTLRHSTDYRARRAAEYPDVGDGLDALAKAIRALADGQPIPAESLAWVEACEAVKARIGKPKTPSPKS